METDIVFNLNRYFLQAVCNCYLRQNPLSLMTPLEEKEIDNIIFIIWLVDSHSFILHIVF